MKLGSRDLSHEVALIAEVGLNHEGSIEQARRLTYAAFEAGADAVKFQTYLPELYAPYGDSARLQRLRKFQLSHEATAEIITEARAEGLLVFSTPLDLVSARFLSEVCDIVKVSSGDITFMPLLREIGAGTQDVILSTGASSMEDVERAVNVLKDGRSAVDGKLSLALLHCVSLYPAPKKDLNLGRILQLQQEFPDAVVGFSDHSLGNEASIVAASIGARIIEKHFTLDQKYSDFRDHALSATPAQLRGLRSSLDLLADATNGAVSPISDDELQMQPVIRRSMYAKREIREGEAFSLENVAFLRPAKGMPPSKWSSIQGSRCVARLKEGDPILQKNVAPQEAQ